MARKAIAATLVSSIIFTSLLVANLAIYSAANNHLAAAALSALEERELAYSSVLTGVAAYSSLALLQDRLSSSTLGCSTPIAYLASLGGNLSMEGMTQGVGSTLFATWHYADAAGSGTGNASIIAPFAGFVAGDLNLLVTTKLNETADGALPSYSNESTFAVHLPIAVDRMVAECTAALAALNETFSHIPSCDSTGAAIALLDVQSKYNPPPFMGLGGSAHRLAGTGACSVDYWVTITNAAVEGVSGPFDWTLSGSESLSVPQAPVSRPPGA